MCQYNHSVCLDIISVGGSTGVGVVPITYVDNSAYCILPVERYGTYANQYNICSGKLDESDRGCYLRGMARELLEELKIRLVEPQYLDMIGIFLKNKLSWFIHRRTPIFYFTLFDIDISKINSSIYTDNNNIHLPACYKEIKYADFIDIRTETPVHYPGNLSSFATPVVKKLKTLLYSD